MSQAPSVAQSLPRYGGDTPGLLTSPPWSQFVQQEREADNTYVSNTVGYKYQAGEEDEERSDPSLWRVWRMAGLSCLTWSESDPLDSGTG